MRIIGPDQLLPDGPGRNRRDLVAMAWAQSWRDLRAALEDPSLRRVMVMVGLPGSGKTRWVGAQPELPQAVAFDSCMTARSRRMAIASRIRAAGKDAIAVVVRAPLGLCLDRNLARPTWRRVPEAAIVRGANMLNAQPPDLREGWSDVWIIDHRCDARTTESAARRRGQRFYRWRTRDDSKVRKEHEARHGRVFAWADPPSDVPNDGHPGEPFGCRCWAEPVDDADVVTIAGGVIRARPLTMPRWARRRPRRRNR